MADALIGHSGFVGSTLLKQRAFDARYRSTDIGNIEGCAFDTIVCAGAPAQKWLANRDPAGDRAKIDELIGHLSKVTCRTFILISTIDVFGTPLGVDENTEVDEAGLHAYGLNRRRLERFVAQQFPDHLIVRLPGLVGPGLRKNVIFDFLNNNNLDAIDSRGVFQFYPMVNLWPDIMLARKAGVKLLHLTAEPVSVADIAAEGFNFTFDHPTANPAATYDMRSIHAGLTGASGPYQYTRRDTLLAVRAYAQSEAPVLKEEK
jgi:hypothetical protein